MVTAYVMVKANTGEADQKRPPARQHREAGDEVKRAADRQRVVGPREFDRRGGPAERQDARVGREGE